LEYKSLPCKRLSENSWEGSEGAWFVLEHVPISAPQNTVNIGSFGDFAAISVLPIDRVPCPEKTMMDLRLGDCLEVLPTIHDVSVDLILTDLPYGVTQCRWDQIIPLEPLWAQYKRIIKPRGAIVLTATQPFTSLLVMSNPKWFRYCWYWKKERGTGFARVRYQPMRIIEEIAVFSATAATYFPQLKVLEKPYVRALPTSKSDSDFIRNNNGDTKSLIRKTHNHKFPTTLLVFPRKTKKNLHPTQKPVALMEYLIKTYTNEGETVLDSCMGSGTTLVACLNTNRHGIGIEKDPEIFATAEKRIQAELDKHALFAM
jgi:site-specific DNA-methyltransferase (adenine-specific)